MIVDSHCHLDMIDLEPFSNDVANVVKAAKQNDVGYFLCVAVTLENTPDVIAIAEQFDCVSASAGLHPNESAVPEPVREDYLQKANHPKVVAIGETGLDYYRSTGDLDWQRDRFRLQIAVARELDKPLIIHSREANEDTIKIMREAGAEHVGGVMHCFAGDSLMAKQAIDMGFYISFSGIITFKNATDLQSIVKEVPLSRIMIETDSPYLAPTPHRGKPNHPALVKHVAEKVAQIHEVSYEAVATQTTNNFFNCFKQVARA